MNTSKSLEAILTNYKDRRSTRWDDEQKYLDEAVAAIVEAVEGLIGEDEQTVTPLEITKHTRNELRAEQRKAIKEWQ